MAMQTSATGKIDRQTTVPFHLKLFYRAGSHHRLDEFPTSSSSTLPPHLQIYTWPSCTLRELSHLLASSLPSLLPSPAIGTRLVYRLIFPDTRSPPNAPGRYLSKDLGSVVIGGDGPGVLPTEEEQKVVGAGSVMAGRLEGEPEKTLQDARFVIGDYIGCAVLPPGRDGEVAPPMGQGMRAFGGARGSEFGRRRETGFGSGYGRGRGGGAGGYGRDPTGFGRLGDGGVPSGEWRRGERLPDAGGAGRGYSRGRGRGGY